MSGPGAGIPLSPALEDLRSTTGLIYSEQSMQDTGDLAGMGRIQKATDSGNPVPLRVDTGPGTSGHYVLVTSVDKGPPRTFNVHDPWDGRTVPMTEEQIKAGTVDVAGGQRVRVTHFYEPSEDTSTLSR